MNTGLIFSGESEEGAVTESLLIANIPRHPRRRNTSVSEVCIAYI